MTDSDRIQVNAVDDVRPELNVNKLKPDTYSYNEKFGNHRNKFVFENTRLIAIQRIYSRCMAVIGVTTNPYLWKNVSVDLQSRTNNFGSSVEQLHDESAVQSDHSWQKVAVSQCYWV